MEFLNPNKLHALTGLILTHAIEFYYFKEEITQTMIELTFNTADFLDILIGK
jgi:hypothetical protein